MHTHQYDEYIQGHEDDDIYQEQIEVDQNFMASDRAGLAELDIGDVQLLNALEQIKASSNKCIQKSKCVLKRQKTRK
jgi:hypothetical protein